MSKFARPAADRAPAAATIHIKIAPRSPRYRAEIAALKDDLELISRFTVGGGLTNLFLFMSRRLIAECREGRMPYTALDEITATLAVQFNAEIDKRLPRP